MTFTLQPLIQIWPSPYKHWSKTLRANLSLSYRSSWTIVYACICFFFNVRRGVHIISPNRLRHKWLSVRNRRLYFLGCTTYRILHSPYAPYLCEQFFLHLNTPQRSFRTVAPSRTDHVFQIISHLGTSLLPQNIPDAVSFSILKKLFCVHPLALEIP